MNHKLKKFLKKIIPRAVLIQRLKHKNGNVFLTFDDGPHSQHTLEVLSILKKYNARAMFFIVGDRLVRSRSVLKMISDEGHFIGNHSYSHNDLHKYNIFKYYKDIKNCQKEILVNVSSNVKFFRPPNGLINLKSIFIPRLLGMRILLFTLNSNDWDCDSIEKAKTIANNLMRDVNSGDIILMHDDNPYTPFILEKLLYYLYEKKINMDISNHMI
ncbi:polysaccharide deacetylase family protein [Desulfuromonas sp. KJ2020]|uniref:polysaccharide deacetylase family protein n=1 Tax=Desulfuromonas sp. KJ2020 TaxID=2919173 RepID=UPI0020A78D1A|nr:polysaccharide deacetylase family protein [Desulfuromonas sp. KJ2020]MCP3178131.1 polysaccharide deacetylase family protein [Desulfuromonas sp. KJ2020]